MENEIELLKVKIDYLDGVLADISYDNENLMGDAQLLREENEFLKGKLHLINVLVDVEKRLKMPDVTFAQIHDLSYGYGTS